VFFSFSFQNEKNQKKRKFFVNRSADKKVALRCFPSATGGCLVLVFCRCGAAIWLFVMGWGLGFYYFSVVLYSSASKGTIKGWAFLYLSAGVLWWQLIILGLLLISGFFPVFSWVLALNSLIINTIHFSGM
jgi:hypothetical protein